MPLSKLAGFMDVTDSELLSLLMAAKCKLKHSTTVYDEQSDDYLHPEVILSYRTIYHTLMYFFYGRFPFLRPDFLFYDHNFDCHKKGTIIHYINNNYVL